MGDVSQILGGRVKRVINAESRRSDLGGSVMADEVIDAMTNASRVHVDMYSMLNAASEQLKELTGNEDAHVVPGAAAGLSLATLATMVRGEPADGWRLVHDRSHDLPDEVVIQASQLSPYTSASQLVGAQLRVIGNRDETTKEEFSSVLGPRTAAVLVVPSRELPYETLSLEEVGELAAPLNIPVIVDAAAQLPPVENLRRFVERGADLVVFSGGKDLEGPASSGLIVGTHRLIECCRSFMYPHHHLGRSFKVGKEEVAGLVAAVRRYVQLDHDARLAGFEDTCQFWIGRLGDLPGVTASRQFPNEAGQAIPRVGLQLDGDVLADTALQVRDRLRALDPAIAVSANSANMLFLTPEALGQGEAELVSDAVAETLLSSRRGGGTT